jgi:hypothetical protein
MTRSHPRCRLAAPIVAAAMLALAFGAVPASAFSTYGVASGAWSKRFTFNGCEMRVRWGVESATGVALNSGRLQNPFFRIGPHGSTLPHATRC